MKAAEMPPRKKTESTYALGAVCRITGLTPDLLRVWERRYAAVVPLRTPKGTRRYRVTDVARLQLLRNAVEAGHRIGSVATLDDAQLGRLGSRPASEPDSAGPVARALDAIETLDVATAERVVADQLGALGPVRFARELAIPLLQGIGERWMSGKICVAAEHMASALLRSMLGAALRPPPRIFGTPVILFATPPGERHELGLLISALVAMGAGASPIYLGSELPAKELARAVELSQAKAVAFALTNSAPRGARREIAATRSALPGGVEIWIGGGGAQVFAPPRGVLAIAGLDELERHVTRLREESAQAPTGRPRGSSSVRPRAARRSGLAKR